MDETHVQLHGRHLGFSAAQDEPVPEDFEGECTGFPEKLLGFKGWAVIGPFCRTHDWHYTILRHHLGEWSPAKWDRFRRWADTELHRKVKAELVKKFVFDWLAERIARAVFLVVRSKLGEMAARGEL
jgi:hypothetical protein